MAKWIGTALLLGLAMGPAAGAQTIVDTFHQFRATLGQLGAKRQVQAPVPAGGTAPSDPAVGAKAAIPAADDAMLPASALAADASDTALERAPLTPRRVATFDVRGLKLGMSPREVARIAAREGFRRRWTDAVGTSGTFEAEATAIADRRLNRPIAKKGGTVVTSATGADASGATLICEWTLEPTGPKLSRVVYSAKLDGSSLRQTTTALIGKYGAPTRQGDVAGGLSWADTSRILDNSSPELIANVGDDRLTLTLVQSPDYLAAARDRLQARAQQIAAARGAGVKF